MRAGFNPVKSPHLTVGGSPAVAQVMPFSMPWGSRATVTVAVSLNRSGGREVSLFPLRSLCVYECVWVLSVSWVCCVNVCM